MFYEPTLLVREVAVYRGTRHAYRESFHRGVNIISGENSSGKSTILSLIVYGLGADISNWSEHAKLCDRVLIEVSLNGKIATFSRLISPQAGQPMDIYPGSLSEAELAPVNDWLRYPYRSSTSRESFSQAVFHLLNIPELETEASGKLTLHQIFRLLYSDQLSSVDHIFRDDNFDTPALREAVGRLLFGAYEAEIYSNQLLAKQLEKELATIESSLRSIYVLLAGVEHSLTLDWVTAERKKIEVELLNLQKEIIAVEEAVYNNSDDSSLSLAPQQRAFSEVQNLQAKLASIVDAEESLQLEFADSEVFIATLERKIRSLQDSSTVAESISEIHYAWCPSCFAPISAEENPHSCRLCKEPFDEDRLKKRIVSQLNDMVIQLKQSKSLQTDRKSSLQKFDQQRKDTQLKWEAARKNLGRVRRTPTSEARDKLRQLNERNGYLKRELEGIGEKANLIERLDLMSRQKIELTAKIAKLNSDNERLKASEADRLMKAYTAVAEETIFFLHRDLPRQDSFQRAKTMAFSFAKDNFSVDGSSYFSASSTVYLKNAFHCAFLFAAARDRKFRHLRLTLLDTIEDKGMEPERSQNFQRLLVDRSAEIEADHQIIFATAMINPALNNKTYVIGRHSTHDHRTLDILPG
ncbi:MAG: AAA family ATPase [Aestuariivirga sp.]